MANPPKTPTENVQEVYELVKSYALQETAVPLQGVGRYLKWGLAGAVFLGLGLILLALAGLRGLQEIEIFNGGADGTGWFVFAPYAIVSAGALLVLAFLYTRISKGLQE